MSEIGAPLDFTICVDRSFKQTYPEWVKGLMHPELELVGPTTYNLKNGVQQWIHGQQKRGLLKGQVIYDHLKASNELANHLGLTDLLAIQAKGILVFRSLYVDNMVFGWRSVMRNSNGNLHVPCLFQDGCGVALDWDWLDRNWDSSRPALRFGK